MEIQSVEAASQTVLDIYGEKVQTETEQAEKLARINIEQAMEERKMAMAQAALLDFYA